MPDERDLIIYKLKNELVHVKAHAYAVLQDMKGKDVMGQLADARECLEELAADFDETPTPEERRKWGLDPIVKVVEDDS